VEKKFCPRRVSGHGRRVRCSSARLSGHGCSRSNAAFRFIEDPEYPNFLKRFFFSKSHSNSKCLRTSIEHGQRQLRGRLLTADGETEQPEQPEPEAGEAEPEQPEQPSRKPERRSRRPPAGLPTRVGPEGRAGAAASGAERSGAEYGGSRRGARRRCAAICGAAAPHARTPEPGPHERSRSSRAGDGGAAPPESEPTWSRRGPAAWCAAARARCRACALGAGGGGGCGGGRPSLFRACPPPSLSRPAPVPRVLAGSPARPFRSPGTSAGAAGAGGGGGYGGGRPSLSRASPPRRPLSLSLSPCSLPAPIPPIRSLQIGRFAHRRGVCAATNSSGGGCCGCGCCCCCCCCSTPATAAAAAAAAAVAAAGCANPNPRPPPLFGPAVCRRFWSGFANWAAAGGGRLGGTGFGGFPLIFSPFFPVFTIAIKL